MMKTIYTTALLLAVFTLVNSLDKISNDEEKAKKLMVEVNQKLAWLLSQETLATWTYTTNMTDYNQANEVKVKVQNSKEMEKLSAIIHDFNWRNFQDRRQFELLKFYATTLSPEKETDLASVIQNMTTIYANARICTPIITKKCNLTFGGVLYELETSLNPEKLKLIWLDWHKVIGPKVRDLYPTYVDLINEKAKMVNYSSAGEEWLHAFELDDAEGELEKLWEQVKPFYQQLHAYIRFKLKQEYQNIVSDKGPIPVHLMKNLYGDNWTGLLGISIPYPNSSSHTITAELQRKKYTPLKMFRAAENFFTSLNMNPMPESFWKHSILERPNDGRKLICHSSAWNLYDDDVRIRLCTHVAKQDFFTIHHEMGHIQFYLQYRNQPTLFRQAANPGFHEAIGDVIALSVQTPKHLKKIGLIKTEADHHESQTINSLFKLALSKVALLPFSFLVDKWRWNVFRGKIKRDQLNCGWWEIVHKYQGLEPPADRSENDFDPGGKYHVVTDDTFVKYFAAIIFQFQIHRSLCVIAGEYDPNDQEKPLHNCDIYGSTAAGDVLKKFLEIGNSMHWHEAMKIVTGQENMDGSGILEYFKPLHTWLEKENKKNGVFIGWEDTKRKVCSGTKRRRRRNTKKK